MGKQGDEDEAQQRGRGAQLPAAVNPAPSYLPVTVRPIRERRTSAELVTLLAETICNRGGGGGAQHSHRTSWIGEMTSPPGEGSPPQRVPSPAPSAKRSPILCPLPGPMPPTAA